MKRSIAEQAKIEFSRMGMIPNLGQRTQSHPDGDVLIFPDGSTALHDWNGDFIVGETEED